MKADGESDRSVRRFVYKLEALVTTWSDARSQDIKAYT